VICCSTKFHRQRGRRVSDDVSHHRAPQARKSLRARRGLARAGGQGGGRTMSIFNRFRDSTSGAATVRGRSEATRLGRRHARRQRQLPAVAVRSRRRPARPHRALEGIASAILEARTKRAAAPIARTCAASSYCVRDGYSQRARRRRPAEHRRRSPRAELSLAKRRRRSHGRRCAPRPRRRRTVVASRGEPVSPTESLVFSGKYALLARATRTSRAYARASSCAGARGRRVAFAPIAVRRATITRRETRTRCLSSTARTTSSTLSSSATRRDRASCVNLAQPRCGARARRRPRSSSERVFVLTGADASAPRSRTDGIRPHAQGRLGRHQRRDRDATTIGLDHEPEHGRGAALGGAHVNLSI